MLEEHGATVAMLNRARFELGMTLPLRRVQRGDPGANCGRGVYESQGDKYNIAQAAMELATYLGESGRSRRRLST
jgi:hypothetical protein